MLAYNYQRIISDTFFINLVYFVNFFFIRSGIRSLPNIRYPAFEISRISGYPGRQISKKLATHYPSKSLSGTSLIERRSLICGNR